MTLRRLALVSTLVLVLPASLAAQQPRQADSPGQGGGGTYLKLGLAHWQRNIFGSRSLTRWRGNLFGSDFDLTSAALEIETYFDRPHLQLSGWSLGYRKDALRYSDSGHMVHAGLFRSFNLAVFELRTSGGVEWGVPSLNFDTTVFDDRDDGIVRYNHVFPVKNADIPFIGTKKDGAVYRSSSSVWSSGRGDSFSKAACGSTLWDSGSMTSRSTPRTRSRTPSPKRGC